jgi:hypothetical protein
VLFAGDLIFNGGTPFVLMGSVTGAIEALENVVKPLAPRVIVPGHGDVCRAETIDVVLGYLRFVLATAILLLLEALPSAIAGLVRSTAGMTRLDGLTRLGLLEGRNLWAVPLLGAIHLAGSTAVIAGLWAPAAGVAGAVVEAAAFGWVLSRQLRFGDRGRVLGAYELFCAMALVVLLVDAIRLS